MLYSRLIKSLIEESIGARLGGYNIEDVVGARSTGGDLIRETLIRAVCDPRFKSTVRSSKAWQEKVQEALEEFAQSLMNISDLDEDIASRLLEDFLAKLFFMLIQMQSARPGRLPGSTRGGSNESDGGMGDEEEEYGEGNSDGEGDGNGAEDMQDAFEDMKQDGGEKENDGEEQSDGSQSGRGGLAREEEQRVQTRFMRRIPKSLVKLAKLIGRSGQSDLIPSGHFLTAAKSDIAGITVGNDLSNLLPSEVAMLSCPQTQDVFFRNFVEKRLQVFASASSGSQEAVHHQDGPVILCLDTSSSMHGRPAEIARAITMAVTIVAQRQHRKVLVVKYAETPHVFVVKNLRRQRKELQDYISIYTGGGNDEEEMFGWLFGKVLPREVADFDSADVLCVSDFGWKPLSDKVFGMIKENKEKGMKFYGLDVTGNGIFRPDGFPGFGHFGDGNDFHLPSEVIDSNWLWHDERNRCVEEKRRENKKGRNR